MAHNSASDILRGTLDLLVLKTLTLEPMHAGACSASSMSQARWK
jgi:hypothetical protein